jgi:hypothetical protein
MNNATANKPVLAAEPNLGRGTRAIDFMLTSSLQLEIPYTIDFTAAVKTLWRCAYQGAPDTSEFLENDSK